MNMNFLSALTLAGAVCVSAASVGAQTSVTYVAVLHPMNANVTGSEAVTAQPCLPAVVVGLGEVTATRGLTR